MHGSALVSLADSAVVMATKSLLTPKTHFAPIALKAKYILPVKQGIVLRYFLCLSSIEGFLVPEL
jgi:acyl-coenzyme A thioesterase PaaI-like protein